VPGVSPSLLFQTAPELPLPKAPAADFFDFLAKAYYSATLFAIAPMLSINVL
jgi:hypothetical protein